jgi:hypothetical protein
MTDSTIRRIAMSYSSTHEQVLKVVDGLDDRQVMWRPGKTAPCIGFHLWHLARWADYLQEMISNASGQIWETEGLAAEWGLGDMDLGFAETGMGLDDDASASLPLPGKDVLLQYARRAFAEADQAVGMMGQEDFARMVQDRREAEWKEAEVGDAVLSWFKHDNRHLGMIECMLGVQGLHGTATR